MKTRIVFKRQGCAYRSNLFCKFGGVVVSPAVSGNGYKVGGMGFLFPTIYPTVASAKRVARMLAAQVLAVEAEIPDRAAFTEYMKARGGV